MNKTIVNNISNLPKINVATPDGTVLCRGNVEVDFSIKVLEELNLKRLDKLSFTEISEEIEQGQPQVVSDTDSENDSNDTEIEATKQETVDEKQEIVKEQVEKKQEKIDNVKPKNTNKKSVMDTLKGMTKDELNDFAAVNDIAGVSMYLKKADIIDIISNAIKSKSGG